LTKISGKYTSSFSTQGRNDAMPKAQTLYYEDSLYPSSLGPGALKHGFKIDVLNQFKDSYKLICLSQSQEANFSLKNKNTGHAPETRQTYILVLLSTVHSDPLENGQY